MSSRIGGIGALFLIFVVISASSNLCVEAASRAASSPQLPQFYDGAKSFGLFDRSKCADGDCQAWIIKFKDWVTNNPGTIERFCIEAADSIVIGAQKRRVRRFAGKCARRVKRFGFLKFYAESEVRVLCHRVAPFRTFSLSFALSMTSHVSYSLYLLMRNGI